MNEPLAADSASRSKIFIQECLQSRYSDGALARARLIASTDGFDWEAVSGLTERERLAPLLYSVTRDISLLPSWYEKELRRIYIQYGFHNARLLQNLQHIINKFADEGLPLIVLKGAALAETVYENIALRPMVDVDILVRPSQVDFALAILSEMGYQPVDPEVHQGTLTQYENELLLHKLGDFNVALELHWNLLDSPHYQRKIDIEWFWQTAETAQISETPSLVLGAEALLLHLSSHIMLHHQGAGLLWLHDVAEVLVRYRSSMNWETVLNKAREYDLVLSLKNILNRVNDQWALELPEEVVGQINRLQPSAREIQVFEWLSAPERPVAQRFWVDLATSSSWKNRIGYAWRNLFPRPSYMIQRYEIKNRYLLPLYYPHRWLKGIASIFKN